MYIDNCYLEFIEYYDQLDYDDEENNFGLDYDETYYYGCESEDEYENYI